MHNDLSYDTGDTIEEFVEFLFNPSTLQVGPNSWYAIIRLTKYIKKSRIRNKLWPFIGFSIDTEPLSPNAVSPVPPNDEDGVDHYMSSGFFGLM